MAINKIPGEALHDNAITSDHISANSIPIEKLSDVNLSIAPETLTIDVAAPAAGQDTQWLWNWEQSTLPYARRTITNSNESNVPLYKQGTYTVNNFAKTQYGSMTQAHSIHLKWIDGAGTQNNISWATDQGTFTDSHPDINGGADTTVQRLSISVPSTITPPTLTAPSVTYNVSNGGGQYTFSGPRDGDNPNIGPLRRGGTYTFNITATGHPFYLTADNGTNFSTGTYFGEYTSGVTGSRTDNGTVTFTVPNNAPDTLYYQCGNHSNMRGAITIKDLAVETNVNGNYVVYAQHTQEGHKTAVELRPIPSLVNQMCLVYDASTNTFVPQDLSTYVENTPSFENKIREVAGTAELVVEDGSTVVAKVNVYDNSTYLPLTDNNAGDQAFATDTNILYIWDGSAWQQAGTTNTDDLTEGSTNLFYTDARVDTRISNNFVLPTGTTAQRPSTPTVGMLRYNTDTSTIEKYTSTSWYSLNTFPTITNISYASGADATDPSGGELVTVTGTNFEIGSTLLLDSVSISYSVVSDTQITFTAPAKTAGDYDLVLVSPQGAQATSLNAISYNGVPTWTTTAGSLGSFNEGDSVSISLVASEPDAGAITYTIVSGSLPSGLSLSGNVISGTAPAELSDTSYPFTIRATDNESQFTDRSFTITAIASATYAVAPSGATAYTADVTSSGSSAYTFSNATDRDGAVSGNNSSINIRPGDTITITNNAGGSHPIYFKTVQGTGTGNLVTGATGQGASGGSDISWTPNVPGTYYYQCSNHGSMNGTIVVQAVEAAEGNAFTFDVTTTNVPDSTTLYWTTENVTTADADFSSTSGSFTITGNSGSFTVTPIDDSNVDTGELFYVRVRTTSASGSVVAESAQVQVIDPVVAVGEHVYTTTGTYQWVCPAGVTSVSIVCVGGGGAGGGGYASGGGGGALAYKNNYTVVPGNSYYVAVGSGGNGAIDDGDGDLWTPANGGFGSASIFYANSTNGTPVVQANGGSRGGGFSTVAGGSSALGDGGGSGGDSHRSGAGYHWAGGGAGGYSGDGGDVGTSSSSYPPWSGVARKGHDGSGGGGGGGGLSSGHQSSAGGGGVGLYGQGSNGAGGTGGSSTTGGGGGSGGSAGTNGGGNYASGVAGGTHGGGGSAGYYTGGAGGDGAVRIIWGSGRTFPSTNTDQSSSSGNITTT